MTQISVTCQSTGHRVSRQEMTPAPEGTKKMAIFFCKNPQTVSTLAGRSIFNAKSKNNKSMDATLEGKGNGKTAEIPLPAKQTANNNPI